MNERLVKKCPVCGIDFLAHSHLGRPRIFKPNPRKIYCGEACGKKAALDAYCLRRVNKNGGSKQ